ncbi:MAG: hypothetical protein EOQ60_27560 [Mesorhizobium sp.]|nr:MAG: hypothetical protein EOQ60_27560 [Mesorhizobium sp.]
MRSEPDTKADDGKDDGKRACDDAAKLGADGEVEESHHCDFTHLTNGDRTLTVMQSPQAPPMSRRP